ncbi:DNA gyrase inhibitor [Thioclava sp. SK-1]|uniref:DNA gyrase inhibitor YacG n=1 Tax=Thioclava sp. SK-1 TaxID=1889770 RepID=UPI0008242597|nr:DNA gyrase inhibitor YacG [Thioclava sp. SK-1]OCX66688.1 DNA gyrase inhibitor [Thioclava sp. SK-1]
MACPICNKDPNPEYRPFCSRRCADIDLAKWLNGSYVIPGDLAEEDEQLSTDLPLDDRPH